MVGNGAADRDSSRRGQRNGIFKDFVVAGSHPTGQPDYFEATPVPLEVRGAGFR
jgi:hypothetical protein